LLFLHSSFGIDLGFLCSFACIYLYTHICAVASTSTDTTLYFGLPCSASQTR
jgi:hypothetical protein